MENSPREIREKAGGGLIPIDPLTQMVVAAEEWLALQWVMTERERIECLVGVDRYSDTVSIRFKVAPRKVSMPCDEGEEG